MWEVMLTRIVQKSVVIPCSLSCQGEERRPLAEVGDGMLKARQGRGLKKLLCVAEERREQ